MSNETNGSIISHKENLINIAFKIWKDINKLDNRIQKLSPYQLYEYVDSIYEAYLYDDNYDYSNFDDFIEDTDYDYMFKLYNN